MKPEEVPVPEWLPVWLHEMWRWYWADHEWPNAPEPDENGIVTFKIRGRQ